MSRKCLWAANTYWGSPFQVGANHYARRLALRGWDVAFISEPVSPMHLLRKAGREQAHDRLANWRAGGARDLDGKIFAYSPMTVFPHANMPGLSSGVTLNHWQRFTLPGVRRRLVREGFGEVDLLVVDTIRQGFWFDAVAASVKVLRVTDLFEAFASTTRAMVLREQELIARADHVFYTANLLHEHVMASSPKAATHVPNGADVEGLLQAQPPRPEEYNDLPGPVAVYVGAIAPWFDVRLLAEVARRCAHVTFVIIGPVDTNVSAIEGLANVRLLGRRPYEQIAGYLKHAQVGIIPFERSDLVDRVSPIKLFDYLACGLPVVSTRWAELEAMKPPAALCDGPDQFTQAVLQAIDQPEGDEKKLAYVRAADWGLRLDSMLNAVGL